MWLFFRKKKKSFAFLEKSNCCELNINDPHHKSLQTGYLKIKVFIHIKPNKIQSVENLLEY